MIEVTLYDGYRILEVISVAVAGIASLRSMQGNTTLILYADGRTVHCVEPRAEVQARVNAFFQTVR